MNLSLLSTEQMRAAEQCMIASGTQSYALMQWAGRAVAGCVAERYAARRVVVLAGPGNNGGDGFIAAQMLLAKGWDVEVALLGEIYKLHSDAARAAGEYKGKTVALAEANLNERPVIIDALFGTGLARPIEGAAAKVLETVAQASLDVVAVDIPSGVHGDTGEVMGTAAQARVTVTFARKKYGHVLLPGRLWCGDVVVADIGISQQAIESVKAHVFENQPPLWLAQMHWPQPQHHKYNRGDTLVIGGTATHAGAAKLAAMAALRAGSGLVSIVCDEKDAAVYAATALSLITRPIAGQAEWKILLKDERANTVLIGPGAGVGKTTRAHVLAALKAKKRALLDADALTSFADERETLFGAIASPCILTPHAGEFARLFPDAPAGTKLAQAQYAANLSQAVVVFKGYDTVIAAPDGRIAVNTNAVPDLATAGAGDVLSGICAGLLAQGMGAFDAACAGVWIHAQAAAVQPTGLIAEDLPARLPQVLQMLKV